MAKLIEVSGIDGSGKTTAVKYVATKLREKGYVVLENREVGSYHIPEALKLREIILDPASKLSGMEMELVFAAMRLMNQRMYEQVDSQYDFIVNDRGYADHIAYTRQNVNDEFTFKFYENLLKKDLRVIREPDYAVYMQLNAETAKNRRDARGDVKDKIEAQGESLQQAVSKYFDEYFLNLNNQCPKNRSLVLFVNANNELNIVQKHLDFLVTSVITTSQTTQTVTGTEENSYK